MKRLLLVISSLFIFLSASNAQCPTLNVDLQVLQSIDCNGGCTGALAVVVLGGTPPYSYQWTGGIMPPTTGLCPGTYSLTVTDFNGCVVTASESLGPPVLTASYSGLTASFDFSPTHSGTNYYFWDFGDGNQIPNQQPPLLHTYAQAGTYNVTVVVSDSNNTYQCTENITVYVPNNLCIDPNIIDLTVVCTAQYDPVCGCDSITYNNACEAQFYHGLTSWTQGACGGNSCMGAILANNSGLDVTYSFSGGGGPGASYSWDFGDGNMSTAASPTHTYATPGTYTAILIISTPNNSPCTYVKAVTVTQGTNLCPGSIGTTITGSDVSFQLNGNSNTMSYYYWTFGDGNDSGAANPTNTYALSGTFNVTLATIDSLNNQCTYYSTVSINNGPLCIDATLIDLSAVCPGLNPVCGCDGVTYDNACIAEKCYGVTTWTQGPCVTTQDSTCTTSVSYVYTDIQGPFGHDVYFFGSGTGIAPLTYFWDFGDGSTGTGINATHTYIDTTSIDSLQAFSVCLTVLDSAGCVDNYCETIVVVVNPNGNIVGGIYEASNFTGNGGISNGKTGNGDPMPNVTVHLERADGAILETDVTDAMGIYSFDQLQFGDYRIRVDIPGVTHAGEPVSLSPIVQSLLDLDFEVDDDGNVSTDVETIAWLNSFQVAPNPANDNVFLEIGSPENRSAAIHIHNLTGQTVYSEQISLNSGSQTFEINLSQFTGGVYFVSLQSEKAVVTRKLIKH